MRKLLALCLWALPLCAQQETPLFNGRNLDGWQFSGVPSQQGFEVKDGVLQSRIGEKGMLWYTREKIGNATIRLSYRISNDKANSGVFIRIPSPPKDEGYAIHYGIEVQIDDRADDYHCTGTLYSMTKALARPMKPAGEWNVMEIKLSGLRTVVTINGVLVTDYDGVTPVPEKKADYEPERRPRPAFGYIGLQNHDPEAVISFREIALVK